MCARVTECMPGTAQVTAPTATTDRACGPCQLSTEYQDETGAASCKPVTGCEVGHYEVLAPSRLYDRVCRLCDGVRHFQDAAGQLSCKSVRVCEPDEREAQAPTPSTDRVCTHVPLACPATEYQDPDTLECRPLTVCRSGAQYQAQPPGQFRDRACANVSAPCDVRQQLVERAAPTATTDRVCGCPDNHFRPSNDQLLAGSSACAPATPCNSSAFEVAPVTATTDRRCQALTVCGRWQVVRQATRVSDRRCFGTIQIVFNVDFATLLPTVELRDQFLAAVLASLRILFVGLSSALTLDALQVFEASIGILLTHTDPALLDALHAGLQSAPVMVVFGSQLLTGTMTSSAQRSSGSSKLHFSV